jgi:hypothetical protein
MKISNGMNKINKILIFSLTFIVTTLPVFVLALDPPSSGLVLCGRGDSAPCTFNDALAMINKIINFTFEFLVVPIAALMFAFAGFKMIVSGGSSPEARSQAKEVFTNTAIGLVIAAGCFILVKALLVAIGYQFVDNFF